MFRLRFRRAVLGWDFAGDAGSGGVREKIGRAPECFVTEHRLDLGFLRGETETKRLAGGWNLTE